VIGWRFARRRAAGALGLALLLAACLAPKAAAQSATAADTAAPAARGIAIGREDAPVLIEEFADFQCPGCAQVALRLTPLLKERYVETGRARFVYYDFPLTSIHPYAFLASRAARCADDQGRFWAYHDVLYAEQPNWALTPDPVAAFTGYAERVGVRRADFEACLKSERHTEEILRNLRHAESRGLRGTPSLFLNGRPLERIPTTLVGWFELIGSVELK
jgi:protein-disulfide isomerase